MLFSILTLFPEMFTGPFAASILKRAIDRGIIVIDLVDVRSYSPNKHRTVDDAPYGGGAGMIIGPEAVFSALEKSMEQRPEKNGRVILMCPQGERFTQRLAWELSEEEHLILICGHYEGIDERVRQYATAGEISVGDYVLTGGELAAMLVVDAVSRLIPGVLGEETASASDSFANGLLEHPHYTRPREFRGLGVPEVLLSGHHARIAQWRRGESLLRTIVRRPELLEGAHLEPEDWEFLSDVQRRLSQLGQGR